MLRTLAHIFLAALILFSSTGITMHKHYCLGELKSVSLYQKADTCNPDTDTAENCPFHCCDDEVEQYKSDDFGKASFEFKTASVSTLIAILSYFHIDFDQDRFLRAYHTYTDYSPPLIDQDIPVMVQSFLL